MASSHSVGAPSGLSGTCEASDCARTLPPYRNCSMCHKDFCHRCTSAGVFCHQCLQYTFLTREPPLPDPIRTADLIAPDSLGPLVRHIEYLKAELSRSQAMVRKLQGEYTQHHNDHSSRPVSEENVSMVVDACNGQTEHKAPDQATQIASLLEATDINQQSNIFLREQSLTEFDAELIANYMRGNSAVTAIDLSDNRIANTGLAWISEALKHNTSVTRLIMYNNAIEDEGAIALANTLVQHAALSVVELSENSIRDSGATALGNALRQNRWVKDLGLSVNGISDAGASELAECLRTNSTLTVLALDTNSIGNAGIRALAAAINANVGLTDVNLSANPFDEETRMLLRGVAANRPTLNLKF